MNNTHLSLFSGIGGLDLAAEWAGFRTVAFVERDKYCQRVLAKHWPRVPIFDDVCKVTANPVELRPQSRAKDVARDALQDIDGDNQGAKGGRRELEPWTSGRVGLISGGFPCQPHSVAGKRKASGDERDLWDECARITDEFRPRWAVFENVPGLLSSEGGSFFARVLGDLASLGYRVGWGVWGANDVGALHRRDRVFIVAHSWGGGCSGPWEPFDACHSSPRSQGEATKSWHGSERNIWSSEPNVGRVANGVPKRVDRLRALGNAVVPQQAYPIFKAIAEIEGIA